MWPTKMKVDWPDSEIGQKMTNGQLLFCTVILYSVMYYVKVQNNDCNG